MALPSKISAALAVLAAAAAAGCGVAPRGVSTGQFNGEARNVAQTIADFQKDAQGRSQSKVCNNDLASTLVSKLTATGQPCPTVIKNQLNEVDNFDLKLPDSSAIQVNGDTATARVQSTAGGKKRFDTLMLVKEGSRWKIASLTG